MGTKLVIDDRFYQLPAFKAAFKAGREGKGDKFCWYRECIFIRMLVLASQNIKFVNASQLSQLTMMPENQCNLVWAVCVEKNVLRQQDGYYSAASWMAENHMLISDNPANPQNIPIQEEKIKMADNVYLSRSEIRDLEQRYSGDEINKMCEYLSSYKKQSGRQYASDYAAINRWVHKAVKDPNDMKYIEGMPDPVPEFIRKAFAKPIGR